MTPSLSQRARLRSLAAELIAEYNLAGWKLVIDERPRRRIGQCRYGRKELAVTGWYVDLNPWDSVEDTLRHEVAHALAGSKANHGPEWVEQCHRVGARAERQLDTSKGGIISPAKRLQAKCAFCGTPYKRDRWPTGNRYCRCTSYLQYRPALVWTRNSATYRVAAQDIVDKSTEQVVNGVRVESLLGELRMTYNPREKKRIRAQLRKLGHRGGLT